MSGHSKWSQIKRQKGANDAKRGALFTKVTREIAVAARQGGGDPEANYRLRLAIEKARAVNMPADNIKRTIDKATGGGDAEQYEEIVYEGYGPGGVAILVEAATDNRNRTASEVRAVFTKAGGQLAGSGAVAWQFERKGIVTVPSSVDEDDVMMAALRSWGEHSCSALPTRSRISRTFGHIGANDSCKCACTIKPPVAGRNEPPSSSRRLAGRRPPRSA